MLAGRLDRSAESLGGDWGQVELEVLLKAKAREAGLEPQAVARRGKSRTIGEVRRGFIEASVLEQGYQASEVASFLGCHASNVSRALQKRESKI